jgi:hypothetical protein
MAKNIYAGLKQLGKETAVPDSPEAATLERVTIHFGGQTGLGIVPVMDDGACWFGAIGG